VPDLKTIDGGQFINWLGNILPDKQLGLVMSLEPPLQQIVMIHLYNAYNGDNTTLLDSLKVHRQHIYRSALHEEKSGDTH